MVPDACHFQTFFLTAREKNRKGGSARRWGCRIGSLVPLEVACAVPHWTRRPSRRLTVQLVLIAAVANTSQHQCVCRTRPILKNADGYNDPSKSNSPLRWVSEINSCNARTPDPSRVATILSNVPPTYGSFGRVRYFLVYSDPLFVRLGGASLAIAHLSCHKVVHTNDVGEVTKLQQVHFVKRNRRQNISHMCWCKRLS